MPDLPALLTAATLAFVVGGITTYFDCYSTLTSRVGRVPESFAFNPMVIGLAILCGLIAGAACWLSGLSPGGTFDTILSLKVENPWRGVVVGASVLVLIRSKLFNIQDSPFGGDYLYQLGRDTAVHNVNSRWTVVRSGIQNTNIAAGLRNPTLEANIVQLIAANIQSRTANFQGRVNASLATVIGNRPVVPFSAADPSWDVYYRALIGVALDACGPAIVRTLTGFV